MKKNIAGKIPAISNWNGIVTADGDTVPNSDEEDHRNGISEYTIAYHGRPSHEHHRRLHSDDMG